MVESVLAIIAAVLPVLFTYLDERKKGVPLEERQKILGEVARNDMGALAMRIDRMRTERRIRARLVETL